MVKSVTIDTDGSCLNHGTSYARAGWGFSVSGDARYQACGKVTGEQDSNRAEVQALLEALRWAKANEEYILNFISDSKFLIKAIKGHTARRAYQDLWLEIEEIMDQIRPRICSFKWVPRKENSVADKLAKQAANSLLSLDSNGNSADFMFLTN